MSMIFASSGSATTEKVNRLKRTRRRQPGLSESEIMTLVIHFHQSGYRDFKDYYTKHVQVQLRSEFPQLVSYSRFVTLMQRVVLLLWAYAQARCGTCTGISFVDSTALRVCTNRRINRHQVFAGLAARGQCSLGWFYGFKLHLVINQQGEILAFTLTPGNVDDRKPVPSWRELCLESSLAIKVISRNRFLRRCCNRVSNSSRGSEPI